MRRSKAPSMKPSHLRGNSVREVDASPLVSYKPPQHNEISSSTSSTKGKENLNTLKHDPDNKILYNIVWRKITTKKHKSWEGDGSLEVKNNIGVLKSETGQFLGTSNAIKLEELIEGAILVIGGKEVEIQEKVKDLKEFYANRKMLKGASDEWNEPEEKKKKTQHSVFFPMLHLTAPKMSKRIPSTTKPLPEIDVEPLILPRPEDEKRFNKLNRPVYEVRVTPLLVQHLRRHQREGVCFLYECVMGFKNPDFFGAILADEMGLGKTLQCLALCHTLLKQGPFGGDRVLQRVLIVCPSSLTSNWNNEINKWLKNERMYAFVVDLKHKLHQFSHQNHIPFVIVSYEMFLGHSDEFKVLDFDLVICDEGHRLKNSATKVSIALQAMNIQRKIILTGTPIQNDLQEFFTLVDFVNPGILGSYQEFRREFENPIVQSQAQDADEDVKIIGYQKAAELKSISKRFILRRTQSVNQKYLPKKREYVVFVRPSELQQFLLVRALELWDSQKEDLLKNMNTLQIITILKKICNHPSLISRCKSPNLLTKSLGKFLPDWSEMGPFDSGKVELVQNFLTDIASLDERVVLVSNHTKTLDMLHGLCDFLNLGVSRLDGSTPASDRNAIVAKFNAEDSTSRVFLLSAKAGGVGLNLCGASRLILFDNDWNPATDQQAMSRIWRDGQKKDVKIYRLITVGTIEEKIFQRQIAKTSLGGCALKNDDSAGGGQEFGTTDSMKFSTEELTGLFGLPLDFGDCATHENLCDCDGSGGTNNSSSNVTSKDSLQINELMKWQHYANPFSEEFLDEACLGSSSESISFIFSCQTEVDSQLAT
ncbi:DNA repair and recombination protein RAD54B-like [Eupeodes corollae]|uniref:DNA repair and recombination protein RAD54B-like n=1 Tax=Eupeodes corollae TaxID=290404 RepID=UPI0024915A42|nr:DNA repair and recombination protein RAD54B-like [Eupeodes corollae]